MWGAPGSCLEEAARVPASPAFALCASPSSPVKWARGAGGGQRGAQPGLPCGRSRRGGGNRGDPGPPSGGNQMGGLPNTPKKMRPIWGGGARPKAGGGTGGPARPGGRTASGARGSAGRQFP